MCFVASLLVHGFTTRSQVKADLVFLNASSVFHDLLLCMAKSSMAMASYRMAGQFRDRWVVLTIVPTLVRWNFDSVGGGSHHIRGTPGPYMIRKSSQQFHV